MYSKLTIHILSLFPQSIEPYLNTSILKKAQDSGLFEYHIHNIADWSVKNTRRVDDRPYGGGAGTIITVEPLFLAMQDIEKKYSKMEKIYCMWPTGKTVDQDFFEKEAHFEGEKSILIICGHYEWIDARIFDFFDIEEISIGKYILSSGELAALVCIDAMVRLIPGVLSENSLKDETFSTEIDGKGEYPQYSRPEDFKGKKVPKVLLSGDHQKIQNWKQENLREIL